MFGKSALDSVYVEGWNRCLIEMQPADHTNGVGVVEPSPIQNGAPPSEEPQTQPVRAKSASRELGCLALAVGFANALLLLLLVMSLSGAVIGGTETVDAPTLDPSPVSATVPTPADTGEQSSIPPGHRMVCFGGKDRYGVIRSLPSFLSVPAGRVPRGGIVRVVGSNRLVKKNLGFVRVQYFNTERQIDGWMHRDILSSTPCPAE